MRRTGREAYQIRGQGLAGPRWTRVGSKREHGKINRAALRERSLRIAGACHALIKDMGISENTQYGMRRLVV